MNKELRNKLINMVIIIAVLLIAGWFGIDIFNEPETASLRIHYIDVGQGDAILIEAGGEAVLIDAGDTGTKKEVARYIKSQGVDIIKYMIGTHPHSDHIGGLDTVLAEVETENIIMPKVMHTSVTYQRLLEAIESKGLEIITPKVGEVFYACGAKFTILAPVSEEYISLNDYSVCLKMEYGSVSFIFTGDAEALSEKEILQTGIDISADVLKVGHHGSHTSTHSDFLKAVSPEIAVISVGKDNTYNHPSKTTVEKLTGASVEIYRTDESGTVVFTTNGQSITLGK